MTHRISSLAIFSVPHVLIAYVPVLKATLPRTSLSFLSSFFEHALIDLQLHYEISSAHLQNVTCPTLIMHSV